MWRGWPAWGALLWIASYIVLTGLIGPRTALVLSTAAYLGTGVVALMRAGDVRARVGTMRATVMSGYPDPPSRDACRKLQALAATLIEADQHRQLELISPIEYEMTWWRVYDQIEPDHFGHTGRIGGNGPPDGGVHRRLRRPSSLTEQHPDIPGASRPRLANTRWLAALQHAEQPNRTHQTNMSRACKIEA